MKKTTQMGAYRIWYEFLRRSQTYIKCCDSGGAGQLADLYVDFGDVRQGWTRWWPKHRSLFEGIEPQFVIDVVQPDQLPNEEADPYLLALLINLYQPQRTIIRDIGTIIKKRKGILLKMENKKLKRAGKDERSGAGAPLRDQSFFHRYGLKVSPRPSDIQSLQRTLDVFDRCNIEDKRPARKRKTRYEIAEELGICPPIALDLTGKLDRAAINRATALTSRYYRQAKNLIKNVEQGIFPDRT